MRRALGLSDGRQEAKAITPTPAPIQPDRVGTGGHNRRFGQDGKVPATVLLGRREHGPDAPTNRIQVAESAAAAEHAARVRAERALAEAQTTIRDLQTKLGHATLTQSELQETTKRERDLVTGLHDELQNLTEQLSATDAAREHCETLAAEVEEKRTIEHDRRLQTELALHEVKTAQESAERLLHELGVSATNRDNPPKRGPGRPRGSGAIKTRHVTRDTEHATAGEPEPVQWWLLPFKNAKR
jgi:hypothetical protein